MSRVRLTKIAAFTAELDRIAEGVQEQDPMIALAIDKISDELEKKAESIKSKLVINYPSKGPAQLLLEYSISKGPLKSVTLAEWDDKKWHSLVKGHNFQDLPSPSLSVDW